MDDSLYDALNNAIRALQNEDSELKQYLQQMQYDMIFNMYDPWNDNAREYLLQKNPNTGMMPHDTCLADVVAL